MITRLLDQLSDELRPAFEQELQRLEIENKLLKDVIRLLRIDKYGPKSEQLSNGQLELLESEPGVVAAEIESEARYATEPKQEPEKTRKRQHPGREPMPAHLPRKERVIVCTPEQCRCAQCGQQKVIIGYDSSEELDVEPIKYFVRVTKREKRACKRCEQMGVSTAPAPELKIVEKGKASNGLIVDVIINKYCNHSVSRVRDGPMVPSFAQLYY